MTIQRLHVGPRLSEAAIHNGVVYLAGQVAEDPSQDIAGQTQQVLSAIDRLLAEAGSDKTRVLQATIFLKTLADFPGMNAVWDRWVVHGQTPPRATVEAKLAKPEYLVEVKIIAAQR
ncbi:MAG TPA: RidA family protein [Burkholderiaceae bacterium]|jgi:enamine deaminase RidA (YjgF/YER057c/UK114 family)|nr:RidA family protein [Burkholderiaceae bacterium]